MNQSVITDTTLEAIATRAEGIIDRPLTFMEKTLIEYALEQVRLGIAERD
jgi:hypothetical protein